MGQAAALPLCAIVAVRVLSRNALYGLWLGSQCHPESYVTGSECLPLQSLSFLISKMGQIAIHNL